MAIHPIEKKKLYISILNVISPIDFQVPLVQGSNSLFPHKPPGFQTESKLLFEYFDSKKHKISHCVPATDVLFSSTYNVKTILTLRSLFKYTFFYACY